MPFNSDAFEATNFEPRTKVLNVPQLKTWFDKGEKPVWKIRALTGAELGNAEEASKQGNTLKALIEGITAADSQKVKQEAQKLLGHTEDKNETTAKKMYHVHYATVWDGPEKYIPFTTVRKLCDEYSLLFNYIAHEILLLSGEGNIPEKKSTPSGKTKK